MRIRFSDGAIVTLATDDHPLMPWIWRERRRIIGRYFTRDDARASMNRCMIAMRDGKVI